MSRVRFLLLALLAGPAYVLAAPGPAGAAVTVTATPELLPPFRTDAHDYAIRCPKAGPVRVKVKSTGGELVAVAHHAPRGGRYEAAVTRRTGTAFVIRVRGVERMATYHFRCLPRSFPSWTVQRHGSTQAQWYVTAPVRPPAGGFVAVFDGNGAPVWWRQVASLSPMPWDAKLLTRRGLAWGENFGSHFGVRHDGAYQEHTLDGRLLRRIHTVGSPTDVHDLQRMPNGHLLTITYRRRYDVDLSTRGGPRHARVFDGEIQELTPGGKVAWRWNSHGHVSPSETEPTWWYNEQGETPPPEERGYDLLHLNSVEPDPPLRGAGGGGVIVSARHANAVLRIERATGRVDWKLGGSYVPGRSLTVVGVPPGEPVFSGQHDARLRGDGTLTVFDNRSRTSDAPAAVRFRIDPVARTATRIERISNADVAQSRFGGSARKLPGGNWVVAWGGTRLFTEQTPRGDVVLALRFDAKHFTYRVDPLPSGRLSAADLRHGMDRIARTQAAAR